MLLASSRIGGILEMLCSEVRLLCEVEGRMRAVVGETSEGESGRVDCGKSARLGETGGDPERGDCGWVGEGAWLGERDRLGEAGAGERGLVGEGGGGEGGGQGEKSLLGIWSGKARRS